MALNRTTSKPRRRGPTTASWTVRQLSTKHTLSGGRPARTPARPSPTDTAPVWRRDRPASRPATTDSGYVPSSAARSRPGSAVCMVRSSRRRRRPVDAADGYGPTERAAHTERQLSVTKTSVTGNSREGWERVAGRRPLLSELSLIRPLANDVGSLASSYRCAGAHQVETPVGEDCPRSDSDKCR